MQKVAQGPWEDNRSRRRAVCLGWEPSWGEKASEFVLCKMLEWNRRPVAKEEDQTCHRQAGRRKCLGSHQVGGRVGNASEEAWKVQACVCAMSHVL